MTGSGGRDRRAVRHIAPAGAPDAGALPERPHTVVVGGRTEPIDDDWGAVEAVIRLGAKTRH